MQNCFITLPLLNTRLILIFTLHDGNGSVSRGEFLKAFNISADESKFIV